MFKMRQFIDKLRDKEIVAAIQAAEALTSGEIRVFVTHHRVDEPLTTAQKEFVRLGMTQTTEHNGVLIYVAPLSRKFAIIGDSGVHAKCGDAFWNEVAAEMTTHFKREQFTEGVVQAVRKAGELLARHFPRGTDGRNQLPDGVVRD